ncbi:MAG: undecaprenyl-diphosphatase [Ignavibacteria bacterium GWF2_33_9]|nr:MAG: undecaprenyl-diphosphatase [Ignavibacteria bacterium GWF2_33_9]
MEIINAIILGIIEGITEFLPISSTGHLILANQIFSFPEPFQTSFDIIIQLGAIFSVVFYFRKRINPFQANVTPEKKNEILDLWKKTIIGVIPALIIGGLLGSKVEELLFNPTTVAIMLFIGGSLLIIIESKHKDPKINSTLQLTYQTVLLIGLIQTLAMIPGTSRSAVTIIGAMLLGSSRIVAAEFSFFLAIPTMFAATGYSILKHGVNMQTNQIWLIIIGFVVSFIVAYSVISFFMKFISNHNFISFGYYRIVLALLVFLFLII